jgi:hypothetical protein
MSRGIPTKQEQQRQQELLVTLVVNADALFQLNINVSDVTCEN